MRPKLALVTIMFGLVGFVMVAAQQPQRRLDDPDDEEALNRELWEFARKTPYEDILPYVAVLFAGRLVVLNTGYYYPKETEPQEVSIIDVATEQVIKTLRINSLFPCAVVGADGKLYISGGYDQKVYRVNSQFDIDREYKVNGFAGGLAFIDDARLAVGYLATKNEKGSYVGGKLAIVDTSSSDSLSVLDARSDRVARTINLARPGSRFGVAPTSCAVSGGRLYVTLAGTNANAVLNKTTGRTLALIPTGWYPTKVLARDNQVFVLSAKGIRARYPNPKGPQADGGGREGEYVLTLLKGSLSIIDQRDISRNAARWTAQVNSGSPSFSPYVGFKLPIRHVFYIIKENRTYDQVLGDLGRGNGDPKLTLFGEAHSPIHHQLAREFVTLDNFFVNGEVSVLGHAYTTAGYASPFFQWIA